jgi:pre-mRNA-splicing factor CWC22
VATSTFIAHLVNQSVAASLLAFEIIILLLERPTDSSVEIAVGFMKEVGAYLAESSPKANLDVFDRFRAVLHEGTIDKRVQYMIEVLFQVRKDNFKDNPIIPEGLDLVEQEDQITHEVFLDSKLEVQESLSKHKFPSLKIIVIHLDHKDVFKFDPDYLQHEEEYKEFKTEVLGEDDSDEDGSDSDDDSEQEGMFIQFTNQFCAHKEIVEEKAGIEDKTETNLVNLRRIIYLTLQNAVSGAL